MAYTAIASGDVDAKSPLTDALMGNLAANDAYLKSAITDGTSASQDLTVNKVTVKGSGTALLVDNNATVTGTFTCGSFVVPDTALLFMGW